MNPDTWQRLEKEFEKFPMLRAEPSTIDEIRQAEEALKLAFPKNYREFVLKYGGAIVGPYPIYGLRPVKPMGNNWSVVEINKHFRETRWPGISGWLIISMDHAGNPIGIGPDETVLVSDHDHGNVYVVGKNFEAFIQGCFKLSGA